MILVDPDLAPHGQRPIREGSDPDAGPRASTTKRAPSSHPTPADRNARVPSVRTLTRFLREAQAVVRLRGKVSVLLTTDRKIRQLNRDFRGKDKPTDVLSFPADPLVQNQERGDLAVSVPTALRQAREQGHALAVELKVLILHGLLHLAGFDHERDNGEMERRERVLRGRLGLPQGLIERTGGPTIAAGKNGKGGARKGSRVVRASRNAVPSAAVATAASAQDDSHVRGRKG